MNPARCIARRAVLAGGAAAVSGAVARPLLTMSAAAGERGGETGPEAGTWPAAGSPRREGWFAPGDEVRHERTWMAWIGAAGDWVRSGSIPQS